MSNVSLKKCLVALDRIEMHYRILQNVCFWVSIFKPDQIDLINVQMSNKDWEEIDNNAFNRIIEKQKESDQEWNKATAKELKGVVIK